MVHGVTSLGGYRYTVSSTGWGGLCCTMYYTMQYSANDPEIKLRPQLNRLGERALTQTAELVFLNDEYTRVFSITWCILQYTYTGDPYNYFVLQGQCVGEQLCLEAVCYTLDCDKSICRPGNIPCNSWEHYQLHCHKSIFLRGTVTSNTWYHYQY